MLDNKTVLEGCDDAARNRCGGKWHMPTYTQLKELVDYTTAEEYTLDGVKGARFISTENGNWIFFPYAGYRYEQGLYGWGQTTNCWTRSKGDKGTETGGNVPGFLYISAPSQYISEGFGRWIDGRNAHEDWPFAGMSVRPIWVP